MGFKFSVRSGAIRNVDSARVSVIGQLKKMESNEKVVDTGDHVSSPIDSSHAVMQTKITEEDEAIGEAEAAQIKSDDDTFKKPQIVSLVYFND